MKRPIKKGVNIIDISQKINFLLQLKSNQPYSGEENFDYEETPN